MRHEQTTEQHLGYILTRLQEFTHEPYRHSRLEEAIESNLAALEAKVRDQDQSVADLRLELR